MKIRNILSSVSEDNGLNIEQVRHNAGIYQPAPFVTDPDALVIVNNFLQGFYVTPHTIENLSNEAWGGHQFRRMPDGYQVNLSFIQ